MLYSINRFFQKGIKSQIILLLTLTLVNIAFFSLLFVTVQPGTSFWESLWIVSTRMLDPGTFSDDNPSIIRWVTYPVTITGILLLSTLIGILSASFTDQLIQLRRGIGRINEDKFTLIIGWDYKIFHLINELIEANSNQKLLTIVILADKDKIEMDEEILLNLNIPRKVKIITRRIDPLSARSYRLINIRKATSIIIVSSAFDNRFLVSKCLLLLRKIMPDQNVPIIFEVNSNDHEELIQPLLSSNTFLLNRESFYSKTMTHTILQNGMSSVFSELFSFQGNELYTYPAQNYAGKSYGDVMLLLENASLIGVIREGNTTLNPDHKLLFNKEDQLVVVMNDDDPIQHTKRTQASHIDVSGYSLSTMIKFDVTNVLILGWNSLAAEILKELSEYVTTKIHITIIGENVPPISELELIFKNKFIHITVLRKQHYKNTNIRPLDFKAFEKIVILSLDDISPEESDTITISTIIQVRSLLQSNHSPQLISQLLIEKNAALIEEDVSLEFIVNDSLVSGMISQIAEDSKLYDALLDLLDEEDAEIYTIHISALLKKYSQGISIEQAYTLIGELGGSMIGYQSEGKGHANQKIHTVLNPKKTSEKLLFGDDKLIVVCDGL